MISHHPAPPSHPHPYRGSFCLLYIKLLNVVKYWIPSSQRSDHLRKEPVVVVGDGDWDGRRKKGKCQIPLCRELMNEQCKNNCWISMFAEWAKNSLSHKNFINLRTRFWRQRRQWRRRRRRMSSVAVKFKPLLMIHNRRNQLFIKNGIQLVVATFDWLSVVNHFWLGSEFAILSITRALCCLVFTTEFSLPLSLGWFYGQMVCVTSVELFDLGAPEQLWIIVNSFCERYIFIEDFRQFFVPSTTHTLKEIFSEYMWSEHRPRWSRWGWISNLVLVCFARLGKGSVVWWGLTK